MPSNTGPASELLVAADPPDVVEPAAATDPAGLARVVLVDSRPERLRIMRVLLERSGLVAEVTEADSEASAIDEVARSSAEIVVLEIQMPIDDGLATVAALRQQFPLLRLLVCSFHQSAATKKRALESGADAYLEKPIDFLEFGKLLQQFATTARVPADVAG